MKSSAMKHYVTQIIIYTVLYVLFLVVMDTVFNGMIVDWLYSHLPYAIFNRINTNQISTALLVYILGLVIISVIYVFKLNKLLNIASNAICEESPKIFGEDCPEELRGFSQRLQDFKFALAKNEQARQLAEQQKNDLVVYLAHDLKTPLTSVIGYLSLLEEIQDLPMEQRKKYIGIALDKAYRLEHLINEFFDITRLNLQAIPTQKTTVNLTILLIQILNEFFPIFEEKKINVIQRIELELTICADADKLARVFDNLFRNAANYSYEGTDLICAAYKQGGNIIVSIQNTGDVIPPEKLNHLFDKFYRLDTARGSATGGTGLGLAIAKQIVELHNGTISVISEQGITEFKVTLPM